MLVIVLTPAKDKQFISTKYCLVLFIYDSANYILTSPKAINELSMYIYIYLCKHK